MLAEKVMLVPAQTVALDALKLNEGLPEIYTESVFVAVVEPIVTDRII